MRKVLKENWFLVLIACVFLVIGLVYTVDTINNSVKGKTVDGKQVVFSIGDKDVTIDELYEKIAKSYEKATLQDEFYKMVLEQAVPTTKELEDRVKKEVEDLVAQYVSYGYDEAYLNSMTKQYYGFDTYKEYAMYTHKEEQLMKEYLTNHKELLDGIKENNPHITRYVVITFADPANPTEEELGKLKAAQDDWANGMDFEELAKKHSQDSNASNGGLYGYIDSTTSNIDETFKTTALALKDGETSEWIKSDQFGYFLIHCDTTNIEDMLNETGLLDQIVNTIPNIRNTVIWKKAESLSMEFANDEIKDMIMGD